MLLGAVTVTPGAVSAVKSASPALPAAPALLTLTAYWNFPWRSNPSPESPPLKACTLMLVSFVAASAFNGSSPERISSASVKPSPSVSALVGSVLYLLTSSPSDRPSPSVSGLLGSDLYLLTSSPSDRPSPSVSALLGSVLAANS